MSIDLITPNQPAVPPKHSLHKLYDKQGDLLYVSKNPNFTVLMRNKWWWNVDHIDITHYNNYEDMMEAKAVAITNGPSKHNQRGGLDT